jgi:hypothetical protein
LVFSRDCDLVAGEDVGVGATIYGYELRQISMCIFPALRRFFRYFL